MEIKLGAKYKCIDVASPSLIPIELLSYWGNELYYALYENGQRRTVLPETIKKFYILERPGTLLSDLYYYG